MCPRSVAAARAFYVKGAAFDRARCGWVPHCCWYVAVVGSCCASAWSRVRRGVAPGPADL